MSRRPKGTPTPTNIYAGAQALYDGGGVIPPRVPAVAAPHLRRLVAAGWLVQAGQGGFVPAPGYEDFWAREVEKYAENEREREEHYRNPRVGEGYRGRRSSPPGARGEVEDCSDAAALVSYLPYLDTPYAVTRGYAQGSIELCFDTMENARRFFEQAVRSGQVEKAELYQADRRYPFGRKLIDDFVEGASLEEAKRGRVVADFNTLEDLIEHAARDLGATHAVVAGAHSKIYFPRGGHYPYEEARVWRKAGYWHAEGPHARTGVTALPRDARPIRQSGRRAAERPRRRPRR